MAPSLEQEKLKYEIKKLKLGLWISLTVIILSLLKVGLDFYKYDLQKLKRENTIAKLNNEINSLEITEEELNKKLITQESEYLKLSESNIELSESNIELSTKIKKLDQILSSDVYQSAGIKKVLIDKVDYLAMLLSNYYSKDYSVSDIVSGPPIKSTLGNINISLGKFIATVNNQCVRKGDTVDGATVINIDQLGVTLKRNDVEFFIFDNLLKEGINNYSHKCH